MTDRRKKNTDATLCIELDMRQVEDFSTHHFVHKVYPTAYIGLYIPLHVDSTSWQDFVHTAFGKTIFCSRGGPSLLVL